MEAAIRVKFKGGAKKTRYIRNRRGTTGGSRLWPGYYAASFNPAFLQTLQNPPHNNIFLNQPAGVIP